jgi:hypothetical protein
MLVDLNFESIETIKRISEICLNSKKKGSQRLSKNDIEKK